VVLIELGGNDGLRGGNLDAMRRFKALCDCPQGTLIRDTWIEWIPHFVPEFVLERGLIPELIHRKR